MIDFIVQYGAWGLFVAAFLAATILPFSSEFFIIGYVAAGGSPWEAVLAASAGNSLGGMTSYLLGYFFEIKKVIKWLGTNHKKLEKIYPYAHRWGYLLGFFGFVPMIGDVVMLALGSLRCSWTGTLITTSIGRTIRYYLIVFVQVQITQ